MGVKEIQGAFLIFILGTVLACLCSGVWMNNELGIVGTLASFSTLNFSVGGGWSVPTGITAWWDAVVTILTWNYPFLSNSWCMFVKIPLWLVSIGVVWGLIQMAISVLSSIVNAVKTFIGG